jgi:hypothetical protein
MGIITISLDKESEKKLRDSAKLIYGNKKGALSKTVMLGVEEINKKRKKEKDLKEFYYLLNNPIKIKDKYKGKKLPNREQLWTEASRKIIPDETIKNSYKKIKKEKNKK